MFSVVVQNLANKIRWCEASLSESGNRVSNYGNPNYQARFIKDFSLNSDGNIEYTKGTHIEISEELCKMQKTYNDHIFSSKLINNVYSLYSKSMDI